MITEVSSVLTQIATSDDTVEHRKQFDKTLYLESQLELLLVEAGLMSDLFARTDRLERIPMSDAEVYYLHDLDLGCQHDSILHQLIADVPWRQENILVWRKVYPQPRLIAWYGDRGSDYTYSGLSLTPLRWTDLLLDIRKRVEAVAAAAFNSVLLNYYRDNRDSMGFHSDDEPELGARPVIGSLSLGQERTFVMKHKVSKLAKPVRLSLASGSLLLMKGDTQKYWKHGIAKEVHPLGPRVNLTFRQIAARDAAG
jgi:alkylated DNA repair dioxygenase AlkB